MKMTRVILALGTNLDEEGCFISTGRVFQRAGIVTQKHLPALAPFTSNRFFLGQPGGFDQKNHFACQHLSNCIDCHTSKPPFY
ncbi:hypothetical protein E2320_006946, partial [Naja naja]